LHYVACQVLGAWQAEVQSKDGDATSAAGAHRFIPILMLTCLKMEEQGVRLGAAMRFEDCQLHGGTDFAFSATLRRTVRQCIERAWVDLRRGGAQYALTPSGLSQVLNGSFQDTLWLVSPHHGVHAEGGWQDGVFINDSFGRRMIFDAASPWFTASDETLRNALAEAAFRLASSAECQPYYEFADTYISAAERAAHFR
jgi:hypothetical protein